MDKVVVITGPTASGKTAVSVELAKKINGEIINADSMQIYKMCDIGSAKVLEDEKQSVFHHMIDIIDPTDNFSTAEYKEKATACIKDILKRGKVPVISGGTGLYIDALVKNMEFQTEPGDKEFREKMNILLKKKGVEAIHGLLVKRDPKAAKTVHPNNSRRVIRYLEILHGFNGTLEEYMAMAVSSPLEFDYRIYILWPEREFIYKRVEQRVDEMLKAGLVNEVMTLIKAGVGENAQSMMGIGYKETYKYIEGRMEYDEFVELLKRNTRRYAKRQFTWLKRYNNAEFIDVNAGSNAAGIAELIKNSYGKPSAGHMLNGNNNHINA